MKIELEPELRKRFQDAANVTYQACGSDLGWSHRAPDEELFVDVMRDLMYDAPHTDLTPEELAVWRSLDAKTKREIILSVGP